MYQSELVKSIEKIVCDRYGNLATPDFHFLGLALEDSPYRVVIAEIEALGATVTEDTDPNTDVSLAFSIENDLELLFLQISVLGPFASLRRVLAGNKIETISSKTDCRSNLESGVYAVLQGHEIVLLEKNTLLTPLPIALPNTSADEATIYHALFSDDEPNL